MPKSVKPVMINKDKARQIYKYISLMDDLMQSAKAEKLVGGTPSSLIVAHTMCKMSFQVFFEDKNTEELNVVPHGRYLAFLVTVRPLLLITYNQLHT